MPLNIAQQDFIKAALDHYLEDIGTEDVEALKTTINKFKKSFIQELASNDEYIHLQKCITQPSQYLRGLHRLNENEISLGQVRHYIFNIINRRIKKAAKKHNKHLTELEWDANTLLTYLSKKEDRDIFFYSEQITVPSERYSGNDIDVSPDEIFQATLIPEPDFLLITLKITIRYRLIYKEINLPFHNTPALEDTEENDDALIATLKPAAYDTAKNKTADIVIDYLVKNNIFTLQQAKNTSPAVKKLLTYSYYLELLIAKAIHFSDIRHLTSYAVNNLTSNAIIKLIENNKITINTATILSSNTVKILKHHFYYSQFCSENIRLEELKFIDNDVAQRLMAPVIVGLLNNKKITFTQAKLLSEGVIQLLQQPFYLDLINKDKLNLTLISKITRSQTETLLRPGIMYLISNEVCAVTAAIEFTNRQATVLTGNKMLQLLKSRITDIDTVKPLSLSSAQAIENDPTVLNLSKQQFEEMIAKLESNPYKKIRVASYSFLSRNPRNFNGADNHFYKHKRYERR